MIIYRLAEMNKHNGHNLQDEKQIQYIDSLIATIRKKRKIKHQ